MPSTDSSKSQNLDGFPLESLDAFDWNHWMTSIGITGCFRLESVDDLPRNTHLAGPGAVPNDNGWAGWLGEFEKALVRKFQEIHRERPGLGL